MRVRAKVYCSSKTKNEDGSVLVILTGVPPGGQDVDGINRAFADATPHIRVEMLIAAGRPAADQYEQGGVYFLDTDVAVVDAVARPEGVASNAGSAFDVPISPRVQEAEDRANKRPEPVVDAGRNL